jgi:hypothetical protein
MTWRGWMCVAGFVLVVCFALGQDLGFIPLPLLN